MRTSEHTLSTTSLERRSRRYRQSVREVERLERGKEGKKPFYLTLNAEGIPYGPGKPAWVAEVNKLAAGLDPSCPHIRKQTHEDMCILKDRLNDHFEYSGDLNQDHSRAVLGKAVTRRRTELISLIQKYGEDAKQPLNLDREIWEKLEKLASSKQRENRTEHGRYANSCRRTIGRTGSIGIEGVCRRLREFYGRSPDPDEVAEEVQRDKGYGKKEMESRRIQEYHSKGFNDLVPEAELMQLRSRQNPVPLHSNEEGEHNKKKSLRTAEQVTFKTEPQFHGKYHGSPCLRNGKSYRSRS